MKTVFCVAYGGGHITIVDLVCRELAQRGDLRFRILALTAAYAQVIDRYPAGTVRRISDYLPLFDDRLDEVLDHGRRLAAEHHNPKGPVPRIESIAYLGLSYSDLVRDLGPEGAAERYRERARQAFLPVETLRRILGSERADIVLSTTSPRCEQAAIRAGNALGLQTVQILDLFGELYPLPEARHVVTSDDDSIATLQAQGLTSCRFHNLGQPVFDDTARRTAAIDGDALRTRLAIPPGTPVVLMATTPPCRFRDDFSIHSSIPHETIGPQIFGALDAVHQERGAAVLLRHHPNERLEDYAPWLAAHPHIRPINAALDLCESLAIADVVVTSYSTIAVQAEACGKPAVTYNHLRGDRFPLPRVMRPPYHFAADLSELQSRIATALDSASRRQATGAGDRDSAHRICDLLASL